MTAITVLLVGGPKDGELLAIPSDRTSLPLAVYVPNKDVWKWFTEEPPTSGQPTFSTKFYRPERIALFGKKADRPVFVYEDADRAAVLAQHLLTPLARGLVGL